MKTKIPTYHLILFLLSLAGFIYVTRIEYFINKNKFYKNRINNRIEFILVTGRGKTFKFYGEKEFVGLMSLEYEQVILLKENDSIVKNEFSKRIVVYRNVDGVDSLMFVFKPR